MLTNSIFDTLGSVSGATSVAITFIIISAVLFIVYITNMPVLELLSKLVKWIINAFAKLVHKSEDSYHRDLEIGKIDEKRKRVQIYRFLSELIIDLDLSYSGITPYELFFLTITLTFVVTTVLCKLIFDSIFMTFLLSPVAIIAVFCIMYTKANLAHDKRIENVIEAENIICNNIRNGVVVAIRDSLDVLPKEVRPDFKDFLDNIEQKNYHIKTALLELNGRLGGVADDFIKKCIVFEMEEEHGIAGMFQDIVEMNNINMEMRVQMKRQFEQVMTDFKIGAGMIFAFLGGVLIIFPDVRDFYFGNTIGQMIIAADILLLIAEYVFITYLRAKEL